MVGRDEGGIRDGSAGLMTGGGGGGGSRNLIADERGTLAGVSVAVASSVLRIMGCS